MAATECGGCQGLGSHRTLCPHHPDYHPWRRLAAMADEIGDTIGANDASVANWAYGLGREIRRLADERPWPKRPPPFSPDSLL